MKKERIVALGLASVLLVVPMVIGAEEVVSEKDNDFRVVQEFGDVTVSENSAKVNFDSLTNDKTRITVTGNGESWLGGGVWTYGLSSTNVWSRYKNPDRKHKTSVRSGYGTRSSGLTNPGKDAIASIKKSLFNNEAFASYE